jgi:hypothetical protein
VARWFGVCAITPEEKSVSAPQATERMIGLIFRHIHLSHVLFQVSSFCYARIDHGHAPEQQSRFRKIM